MHETGGGAVGTVGDYWMVGNFTNTGNSAVRFTVPIGGFPTSSTITEIRVRIYPFPATGTLMPTVMPRLDLYVTDGGGTSHLIGTVTDTSTPQAAYETPHDLVLSGLTLVPGSDCVFATLSTGQGTLIGGTKILSMTGTFS